jgi:excisionase family DNA binding protein
MRKAYTTEQAAELAGVPRTTLQHWIKSKRISAPAVRLVGGKAVRSWSRAQVAQIRKMKGTLKPGPKKGAAHRAREKNPKRG